MKQSDPGFIAYLPSKVRYDNSLPFGARIIYAEISALCNAKGYCWANNKYFADLYNNSKDTISRWIADLEKQGYIKCFVSQEEGNARKIYLVNSALDYVSEEMPLGQKESEVSAKIPKGSRQKSREGIGKNAEHNSIVNNIVNNINNNKENKKFSEPSKEDKQESQKLNENDSHRADVLKKVAISAKDAAKEVGYKTDSTLVDAFQMYIDYRKEMKLKPFASVKSAGIALKQLKRLSEDSRCTSLEIVEQTIANLWTGLFPLKRDKSQQNGKTHYQPIPEEYGPQPF